MALVQAGRSARRGEVAMARTFAFCYSLAGVQRACFPPGLLPPPLHSWQQPTSAGEEPQLASQGISSLRSRLHRASPGLLGLVPCRPQIPSLGCMPLCWESLHLPALHCGSLSSSLTSCFPDTPRAALLRKGNLWRYF